MLRNTDIDIDVLENLADMRSYGWEINVVKTDGTHSAASKDDSKAYVAIIRTTFYHDESFESGALSAEDADSSEVCPEIATRTICPFTQKVPDPCDGKAIRAMNLKIVRLSGMADWLDDDLGRAAAAHDVLRARYFHWRLFLFTTDKGGDEQGSDGLLADGFSACGPLVSYMRQWCFQHACHKIDAWRHSTHLVFFFRFLLQGFHMRG